MSSSNDKSNASLIAAIKWIVGCAVVWYLSFYLWVDYCSKATSSEAGQAAGLLIGFVLVTFGAVTNCAAIALFFYLKNNRHKGFSSKNILAGVFFVFFVLCLLGEGFMVFQTYQEDKEWKEQRKDWAVMDIESYRDVE